MKPKPKLKYIYNSTQNSKNAANKIDDADYEAKLVYTT